ncbi:HpcH/HpaI aldolase/citrate lyase family protein [Pelomicrobium methylotrophicum]|uniref:CoA ester lyase n=1 Tax=Pelomicrobium methylotrophicum TaxID=2602750 RepID=A0A5C7EHH8_9PROT|nr:aldolase/citrate lyase family protein [Pelomicrobium methylotrophicum]TXF10759.1 CoA ester lyase [Pelomicrobium methylotrophicum]
MPSAPHPEQVLFQGEKPFPWLPACEHYAGNERFILKALEYQQRLGPLFDVSCDCEDGAPVGRELEHAQMVAELLNAAANRFGRCGVRIHGPDHPHWRKDVDVIIDGAGHRVAYVTLPKVRSAGQAREMIEYLEGRCRERGLTRRIPVHVLIETHGALRDAFAIAALPGVETLDFGLLDFVSGHHGAIPASAMRSPAQFEHHLIRRAKCEVVAAALAHGCVPVHNVTTDLDNPYRAYEDAWRARTEYGFLRMWSIHPSQIQPIVDAMRPRHQEIEEAATILLAAQRSGWAPIRHRGELHDRASYRYYWCILRQARATGTVLPPEVEPWFAPA